MGHQALDVHRVIFFWRLILLIFILGASIKLVNLSDMPKLTTVFWRDIPAQVIAKERREAAKTVLSERFAEAIDKAAMRAKMAGTDAYLEQWRREVIKCGKDLQAAVDEASSQLEQTYTDERLKELVKTGGLKS